MDKSADEETIEKKELPCVEKDSGPAEQSVNDNQRCAVTEEASATEDNSQVNEAQSEVKRCADHVILCHV